MEDKNKPIDPTDQQLKQLIGWMIDNVTIRELLKYFIDIQEKRDNTWIDKIEQEAQNNRR